VERGCGDPYAHSCRRGTRRFDGGCPSGQERQESTLCLLPIAPRPRELRPAVLAPRGVSAVIVSTTEQRRRPKPHTLVDMAGSTTIPAPAALIPGAYERNTLTHRQTGSMGGPAFGSATAPGPDTTLSRATILDREREGGGGPSQRPRRTAQAPHASTIATTTARAPTARAWFRELPHLIHHWFRRPTVRPHA
jgi:hypothetical protein